MSLSHIVGTLSAGGYALPIYGSPRPADLDAPAPRRVPVVVVGGGLSGLACATDLVSRGVSCTLLDDDDTVGVRGASSRGIAYARKTLEILDRLGALAPVLERGITWSTGRTFDFDRELFRIDLAHQGQSAQPPFVNIQQFRVEAALVDRAWETGVDIRWKHSVRRVDVHDDHAVLDIETPHGAYRLEADWVIDATGVHSTIRDDAGIRVEGEKGDDIWCICDVRLAQGWPMERWTWVRAAFNGGRAVWRHPLPDDVWRLDYQLAPGTDVHRFGDDDVRRLVSAHLGPDVAFEVVWSGPWSYRNQLAQRFRAGRVVLIGDAAHAFSPFGGRGGNSGIQDAENLAWKLARVLRGKAPASLIDTYAHERRAAARHNLDVTSATARFLGPPTAAGRAERDRILAAAATDTSARASVDTGKLSEAFIYPASSIVRAGGQCLPNIAATFGDGRTTRLSRLLEGPIGGLLLSITEDDSQAATLRERVAAMDGDVRLVRVCERPQADELQSDAAFRALLGLPAQGDASVWVRPDGHVAAIEPGLGMLACMPMLLGHADGPETPD